VRPAAAPPSGQKPRVFWDLRLWHRAVGAAKSRSNRNDLATQCQVARLACHAEEDR
jgi:hypothetical protein